MYKYQKLLSITGVFFSLNSLGFSASHEIENDGRVDALKETRIAREASEKSESDIREALGKIEKKCSSEFHVLFLCAGNATRSQVAEGWLQQLGGDAINVLSAGIDPRPVNHKALTILEEFGLHVHNPTSKRVTADMLEWADLVITTCEFSHENCPELPAGTVKINWTIENYPSKTADAEQMKQQLHAMSDEIQQSALTLLDLLKDMNYIS